MVKALIIITIFICCSYVGFIYGDSFRKRFQDLKEVYKQITLLQNEVVFNNTPIPEALYALGKKGREPLGEILINTAEELMEGKAEGIYEAFKKSYLKKEEELYFTKEDKNVLKDFIKNLGESGVYGQEKIFKLVLENLKISIEEALETSKKNTKLYRYLGMCLGAMIAIFLL